MNLCLRFLYCQLYGLRRQHCLASMLQSCSYANASTLILKWHRQRDLLMVTAKKCQEISSFDDSQIVSLTLSGNTNAFEVLVRRYQKLVYNVLYRMVLHHESACDLTQETFLRAFKALSSFRVGASFKPWLLTIASNLGLNYVRDRKEHGSLNAILEDNPTLEPTGNQDVEREVEWCLSLAMLSEALNLLSVRHRQFFVLRYQYDLSYADISSITGVPETTLKPLMFRVREELRRLLKDKMLDRR